MPDFDTEVRKNSKKDIKDIKDYDSTLVVDAGQIKKMDRNDPARKDAARKLAIKNQLKLITKSLEKINAITDKLYEKEGDFEKLLNNEEKKDLIKAYEDSIKIVQGAVGKLTLKPSKDSTDPTILERFPQVGKLINSVMTSLGSDYRVLSEYAKKNTPMSIQEIFDKSRGINVDLGDKEIKTVGGNISSRLPFSYHNEKGKKVSGVFTAKSIYNPAQALNDVIEGSKEISPEFYELMLAFRESYKNKRSKNQEIESDSAIEAFALSNTRSKTDNHDKLTDDEFINNISDFAVKNGAQKLLGLLETAKNSPKFKEAAAYMNKNLRSVGDSISMNSHAKIEKNSRIDNRNTAMSVIASVLGKDKLVAKASPMIITHKGRKIEGTFMKLAKGQDYNQPTEASGQYTSETFKTNGLASFSDLMVLDYICGNIDRHAANFMYQFDTSDPDPSKHKFIGVQGFDNDCSFGEILPISQHDTTSAKLSNKHVNQMNSIEGIQVISASMANVIRDMDVSVLKFKLQGLDLSEKQINALESRMETLKAAVENGLNFYSNKKNEKEWNKNPNGIAYGHLKIVKDSNFNKLDIEELAKAGGGSYNFLTGYGKRMQEKLEQGVRSEKLNPAEVDKLVGYRISKDETKMYEQQLKDMKAATSKLRGTSNEFEKLRDSVKNYAQFCRENEGSVLTPKQNEIRNKMLQKIMNDSASYLDHKGVISKAEHKKTDPQPKFNSYEQTRVDLVSKIAADAFKKKDEAKDLYANLSPEDIQKIYDEKAKVEKRQKGTYLSDVREQNQLREKAKAAEEAEEYEEDEPIMQL